MHHRPGPAGSYGHLRDEVRLAPSGRVLLKRAIPKLKVSALNRYLRDEIMRLHKILFVLVFFFLDVQQVSPTPSQLVAFLVFCTSDFLC